MIKQIRASYFANFKNAQYCALSTDPIPDYLENGDEVYIINTRKRYIWDASSSSLIEQPNGGSGATDAGSVEFDPTETYPDGTVGKALTEQRNAISQKQDATSYVTLSGTIVTQTGADNTMYLCGELAELTFTAPATGITAVRFTSGTTPTVVTLNGITMPDDWTGAEASTTYEINVLNGLGAWQSWT